MRARRTTIAAGLLVGLLLVVCSCADRAGPARDRATASEVDDPVARWWRWAAAAEQANPVSDRDGHHCAVGQPDDLWFLAGSWGETVRRTCVLPSGIPVFGPVGNRVCDLGTVPVRDAPDDCGSAWTRAEVTLDGTPVRTEERESLGVFELDVPDGSPVLGPGRRFAYSSGIWFGPLVLADGEHTLHIVAAADGFDLDVTYRLTVG